MKLWFAVFAASATLAPVVASCAGDESGAQRSQTSSPGSSTSVSVTSTTAVPVSSAAPSTLVDVTVNDSIGATATDLLASWPSPPTGLPDLANVPMLLPTVAMTGVPSRSEHAHDAGHLVQYQQYWLDGSDGTLLSLQTDLLQAPAFDGEPANVDPWD